MEIWTFNSYSHKYLEFCIFRHVQNLVIYSIQPVNDTNLILFKLILKFNLIINGVIFYNIILFWIKNRYYTLIETDNGTVCINLWSG